MKQKIVIKVSMSCAKSRSKAMELAARADGVVSMGITGDEKNRLKVVGDDVDSVCLVSCLRKKVGHAEILQVEEVKEKKAEENKQQQEDTKVTVHQQPYYCYPVGDYHHQPPMPPMVVCDDERSNCSIM
ncbi:hypothetical protein PR202_ga20002 [Eleusine coracana subsp. coracana]|uniref:HMA domain-containing protein n=1 Tax=Eleusine coracana subsp. coracana TaxID=191504 RepID=A0AAV5CXL2_ELECO|nr:hypothetical protein QOZ80_4AG0314140 [Eleusine coracana subsp. coracana]GJN02632.1 hypothetical protein PR202_ga20002 [Eleusine coracana subsp. coracana]